ADERGTVRLERAQGAWRLRLTEGSFSGCGAGWTNDVFGSGGPPHPCDLLVPETPLDRIVPATRTESEKGVPSGIVLAPGDPVLAVHVDAILTPGDYVMARSGRRIGLVARKDVRCRD